MIERADDVRQGITALRGILDEARTMAETGVSVDLAGLDGQVEQLCEAARTLPAAEAKSLLDDLDGLAGALDTLRGALARQRDTLLAAAEGRADPHTARQRATAAYGRSPIAAPIEVAVAPPGDSEETR